MGDHKNFKPKILLHNQTSVDSRSPPFVAKFIILVWDFQHWEPGDLIFYFNRLLVKGEDKPIRLETKVWRLEPIDARLLCHARNFNFSLALFSLVQASALLVQWWLRGVHRRCRRPKSPLGVIGTKGWVNSPFLEKGSLHRVHCCRNNGKGDGIS